MQLEEDRQPTLTFQFVSKEKKVILSLEDFETRCVCVTVKITFLIYCLSWKDHMM